MGNRQRSWLRRATFLQKLLAVVLVELMTNSSGHCCECGGNVAADIPPPLSTGQWEEIDEAGPPEVSKYSFRCAEEEVSPGYWPYAVQPQPIHFIRHPVGVVVYANYITLKCSISSSLVAYNDLFQPKFRWELNGTAVSPSNVFIVEANVTSSLLTVDMKSGDETEGVYTCFVEDYYFSLQSLPAQVWKPRLMNWTEEVYDDSGIVTVVENNYLLSIQEGGTAMLECTGTGLSSQHSVHWLSQSSYCSASACQYYLPNGNLLIQNFSLPSNVDIVQYTCVVNDWGPSSYEKYYFLYISTHVPSLPTFLASPRTQDIAVGQDLILYCIASGELPISYSWTKDGKALSNIAPDGSGVLVVGNSSLGDTGDYTCTVSNRYSRISATAHVVVRGPPEVTIIPHPSLSISPEGDVLLPHANASYSVSLQCRVSSNSSTLQLTWLFRGQPVPDTDTNAVSYSISGSNLTIASQGISDATGSVQCLAEDVGGRGSGAIRIVQKAKPNPFGQININILNQYNYTYHLEWTPPIASGNSSLASVYYQVQLTYLSQDYPYPQCLTFPVVRDTSIIFDAKNEYGLSDCTMCAADYQCTSDLLSSVNVSITAFYSETPFITSDGRSSCFHINEALDDTLTLAGMHETVAVSEHFQFNVALSWQSLGESYLTDSVHCGLDLLYYKNYFIHWLCDGWNSPNITTLENGNYCSPTSYNIMVDCVTSCEWKVGITPLEFVDELDQDLMCNTTIHWTSAKRFETTAMVPAVGGDLVNVTWASNGKSFLMNFTLPSDNIICNPSSITIFYEYKNTLDLSGVTIFSANERSHSVGLEQCWLPYSVSFVYNNSAGSSPLSNTLHLPLPSAAKAVIFSDFSIRRDSESPSTLFLTWSNSQATNCLYNNNRFSVEIFLNWGGTNNSNCEGVSYSNSSNVTKYWTMNSLTLQDEHYFAYCIQTKYWLALEGDPCRDNPYKDSAYVAVPSMIPPTNPGHDGEFVTTPPNSSDESTSASISSKNILIAISVIMVSFFILIIIITVVVICLACRIHRKDNTDSDELEEVRRLVPEGSEERRNIVCKDLETDEIHSVHTQYDRLTMDNFLNDVSLRASSYMSDIAEEMDVDDDTGDKIPQPLRPVTPSEPEPLITRHTPLCTDKSPVKLETHQQQSQPLPTDVSTESQYFQPDLMGTLNPGRVCTQGNLIELDDMTLHRDDLSIRSSSLIHMSDYVGGAGTSLSSPSSIFPNTLTATRRQHSHQPSLTVANCNLLLSHQKRGGALPSCHTQVTSSMPGQELKALQPCHPSDGYSQDKTLSQGLSASMEVRLFPCHIRHAAPDECHCTSSCHGNVSHDGYIEESMQKMHQRDHTGKPGNCRVGSPATSVDCLHQESSHPPAGRKGLSWDPHDFSSPLPPKNPFQSSAVVSDALQTSLTRPSSQLSTDSGMTLLSSSSSEQSVFGSVSEQQPFSAKSRRYPRRHSSGISSMPSSIPATPDAGQQSFHFPDMEAQLNHSDSRSSLPFLSVPRTRAAAVGSEYISDPSRPFFHTPKRAMQSMAGSHISYLHSSDPANRHFHQTSHQGSNMSSPSRPLSSSTIPTHIPDIAMQQTKFSSRCNGRLSFPPTKGVSSTPTNPSIHTKINHDTLDYLSSTSDYISDHTVHCSSAGHKEQGHTGFSTGSSRAMLQIPSLLPHCHVQDTYQQALPCSTVQLKTDSIMPKFEWDQSSTPQPRTLQSEPILEDTCSDGTVLSRRSSADTELYSLGSLSPSMEDLSRLNNTENSLTLTAGRVVHDTDSSRATGLLSDYANTDGIETDGVVFSLQEAFS